MKNPLIFAASIFAASIAFGSAQDDADAIFNLYDEYGEKDYIGEDISQTEHALMVAYVAKKFGQDDEYVLSSLLHDIGHLLVMQKNETLGSFGAENHETIGAKYLQDLGFSERSISIIKQHVNAKRYLCFADPNYYKSLSNGSKQSLALQGGPMNQNEANEFKNHPYFNEIIAFRKQEDMSKRMKFPKLGCVRDYQEMLVKYLDSRTERDSNP